jgi:mRNA interferase HigB
VGGDKQPHASAGAIFLDPRMGARYDGYVRVIARGTLIGFVGNRVTRGQQTVVKTQLDAWYDVVRKAEWGNSAELKAQIASASILTAERVVFNIKGNDYRLIAAVNYPYKIVRIKWIGTHREYDRIDAREVEYDKQRYSGSPHSD